METTTATKFQKYLDKSRFANDYEDLAKSFNAIIETHAQNYDGKPKAQLKSFFEDLQRGGCMSGLISEFIYHHDTKAFYIEYIDDLEAFKEDLEEELGEMVGNRHKTVHYTFVVWLCFEEYCFDLYSTIFGN